MLKKIDFLDKKNINGVNITLPLLYVFVSPREEVWHSVRYARYVIWKFYYVLQRHDLQREITTATVSEHISHTFLFFFIFLISILCINIIAFSPKISLATTSRTDDPALKPTRASNDATIVKYL